MGIRCLWREKHGGSSYSRTIHAEKEMCTIRIILRVSCNLLMYPVTDAQRKRYTDVTCLITNRSSAALEINWRGEQVEKNLTSDSIPLSLLIPVTCSDSAEELMCQVRARRLMVTHHENIKNILTLSRLRLYIYLNSPFYAYLLHYNAL
jgi:hypothetical protein